MRTTMLLAIALTVIVTAASCAAPIKLVEGEGTTFVIYVHADAPPSVAAAAQDLQDYMYRAAKAKLAIVDEPVEPMICLGDNASARAAKPALSILTAIIASSARLSFALRAKIGGAIHVSK